VALLQSADGKVACKTRGGLPRAGIWCPVGACMTSIARNPMSFCRTRSF